MTTPSTNSAGKDRVFIFDTTMRDGEQSPGASMTLREKLELAELLQEMKVDVCEAGFAASSEGDFQCVSQIEFKAISPDSNPSDGRELTSPTFSSL